MNTTPSPAVPTLPALSSTPVLPLLEPADADLLNKLLNANLCLANLAAQTGFTLPALIQWRSRPDIDAYITLFLHCQAESEQLAAQQHTRAALDTLASLIPTAKDNAERQRLAAALLRGSATLLKLAQPIPLKPTPRPIRNQKPAPQPLPFKRPEAKAQ